MKSYLTLTALFLLSLSFGVQAKKGSNKQPCHKLVTCIEHVSKLTGKSYFMTGELTELIRNKTIVKTNNFDLNDENADHFLSELLYANGLARVSFKKGKYQVISAKDMRFYPTKIYEYGKDKLPNHSDYITVIKVLNNPYVSNDVVRSIRPFFSRYGRAMNTKDRVYIMDTARNAKRLFKLIDQIDRKFTKEEMKEYERRKEDKREIEFIRAKNPAPIVSKQ